MSLQTPSTPEEITQAIQHARPFQGAKLNGEAIYVLSGEPRTPITGPLADAVRHSASDYKEQYLTGGGRERAAWHVIYYVTMPDPDVKGARFVLGYITASGETQIRAHRELSKPITAAVSEGFGYLRSSAPYLASDRGAYPTQPEGHTDGKGATFHLWVKPMNGEGARVVETFTGEGARQAAYAARQDADRLGLSVPRSERQSAWVEREEMGA